MVSSSQHHPFLYLGLIFCSVFVFVISLINQSVDQTSQSLGLSAPDSLSPNQQQVEIIVPVHCNYSLPPPGLLPTHPLYFLKMIKDRLILALTLNQEQHTRHLFTYSNIRMSAANQLIELGQVNLAVSTATKGQNYLWQAINSSPNIPLSLQPEWYTNLKLALLKHEEIIEKIRFVAKGGSKQQSDRLWNQLADYRQQVANLSGMPFDYPRPEDTTPLP